MISPDLLRSPQVLAKLGALHGLKALAQLNFQWFENSCCMLDFQFPI